MKIKQALDHFFKDFDFDINLYKKLVYNNIEFITRNDEYKNLFGSKLIGNHLLKYTTYDKNIFYNNLFGLEVEDVVNVIDKITTINKNFKIARDDINLITFYIAHRFLSNEKIAKEKRLEYAKEILNYFNYRTLVLISSNYFIYPISEEKAVSLSERLSNRYVIKKLKNWNEYCIYRSEEYLESKFLDILIKFDKDSEIPNAITDLFNRTKDTLKNIYGEFITMMENDEIIKSRSNVVNDIEGQEVIIDKLNTPESYFTKLEGILTDRGTFIKKDHLNVTIDIINSISYRQLEETLIYCLEYNFNSRDNHLKFTKFIKDILINSIEYLHKNNIYLSNKSNTVLIINNIVGNVLYARGNEIDITKLKSEGDKLIKEVYKFNKKPISDRTVKNLRNAIYVYIMLLALIN